MSILLFFTPFLLALSSGEPCPEFSAKNQDGKMVHLSNYKNKFILIYFYPKDDTPGCTKEACSFRDEYQKLLELNTVILGVSRQDEKSHQAFRAKHKIPFDLLVDTDGSLAQSLGVGTLPVVGFTKRQSILVDPSGKIIHFYENVDPTQHTRQVLEDILKAKQ